MGLMKQTKPLVNPTKTPPIPNNPLVKSSLLKKPIFIVLLVILLVALSSLATYLITKSQFKPQTPISSPVPSVQPSPSLPVIDETSGWKKYDSLDGNFSIKYPYQYELKTVINLGPVINHNITLVNFPVSFKECRVDCPIINSSEEIVLAEGISATKIKGYVGSIGGNIPESFVRYEVQNPKAKKSFGFNNITLWELPQDINYQEKIKKYPSTRNVNLIPADEEKIFGQILSTFKFPDQNGGDLSTSPPAGEITAKPEVVLNYELPSGWKTVSTKLYSIGYDLEKWGVYCPSNSDNACTFTLTNYNLYDVVVFPVPYDGGSRRETILNRFPGSIEKTIEIEINGKKALLVIDNPTEQSSSKKVIVGIPLSNQMLIFHTNILWPLSGQTTNYNMDDVYKILSTLQFK